MLAPRQRPDLIRRILLKAALLLPGAALPLLTCAAALLLPSCKQWFIGEHLRGSSTTYMGVDIFHPVDGNIHANLGQGAPSSLEAYVIAPEVTYTRRTPWWEVNGHALGDLSYKPAEQAYDIRPTGRVVIAKIDTKGFNQIVSALPKGLTPMDARDVGSLDQMAYWNADRPCPRHLGELGEPEQEKPGFARRALISTCDYVVDPLLNIISGPVEVLGFTALSPILIPALHVMESQQQVPPSSAEERKRQP